MKILTSLVIAAAQSEKRSTLEMLAKVLIEKEIVARDALTALLAAHELRMETRRSGRSSISAR